MEIACCLPILPDIQHVAEFAVLSKDFIHLRDALFQYAADSKERSPPFRKVAHDLVLKPFSFLIPTAIPCVSIGNVRVAQKE